MSNEFLLENRYLVLKRSDIAAALSANEQDQLYNLAYYINGYRQNAGKGYLRAIVVEQDWPEYNAVQNMIAGRVNKEQELREQEAFRTWIMNNLLNITDSDTERLMYKAWKASGLRKK